LKRALRFIVVFALSAAASGYEYSIVSARELSLGGIAVGDSEDAVLARFGQPRRRTDAAGYLNVQIDYPGLTIWVGEGRHVAEVLSTSGQYCTPAGLCPGMAFEEVHARYGTPLVSHLEEGSFLEYPTFESACWLQIAVRDAMVRSVRAVCRP
jgi:hypothetical protein